MGEVRYLNTKQYAHVVCSTCRGNLFSVRVSECDDPRVFEFIVCEKCGTEIPINMTPCFGPGGTQPDRC